MMAQALRRVGQLYSIPLLLLAWLLVWEFDARPRAVAWIARGLCLLAVVMHAPRYMLPAPKDYHWAEHVDPIRQGVPTHWDLWNQNWSFQLVPATSPTIAEIPARPTRPIIR